MKRLLQPRWIIAATVLILDLISKVMVLMWIDKAERIRLFYGLDLTHVYNHGAAFSFLNDAGGWQRYFFIFLALAICSYLAFWLYQIPRSERWLSLGLTLILGGAVGNLIDRVIHGYVVDFILVYYGNWSFPVFNIADSAISVGATLVIALVLFRKNKRHLIF